MKVRITKYNPANRNENGHYTKDEWTCFSLTGTKDGPTWEEYKSVEDKYWQVLDSILVSLGIETLKISGLEYDGPGRDIKYSYGELDHLDDLLETVKANDMEVTKDQFHTLFKAVMRNVIWFDTSGKDDAFVDFGGDYYLYAGSNISFDWVDVEGIFVEERDHLSWRDDPDSDNV